MSEVIKRTRFNEVQSVLVFGGRFFQVPEKRDESRNHPVNPESR